MLVRSQLIDSVGPRPTFSESAHGTITGEFPLVLRVEEEQVVLASHSYLPIETGSIDRITCSSALEYVRDDESLLQELARILRPNGLLYIEVPNSTWLGKFDHMNVYRYIRDITKRGDRLPELAEVGWRRHYAPQEVEAFLDDSGLQLLSIDSKGLGFEEAGNLARVMKSRWLQSTPQNVVQNSRTSDQSTIRQDPLIPLGLFGWKLRVIARLKVDRSTS